MAGPDDFFKANLVVGVMVGVGAVVLAPLVLPVLAAVSRPLAKSTIKTGVILFEKGREAAAEMGEVFEDLLAEARAELDQSRAPSSVTELAESTAATVHAAEGPASASSGSSHETR